MSLPGAMPPSRTATPASASGTPRSSHDPPQTLKLLLIGNSSVGKSSLLLRFTDEVFLTPEETTATIGVDFKVKSVEVNGKRYKLSIWDTAGQERFRTLTSSYYRGAQGVILVYDVSNRESFDKLKVWFNELETYSSGDAVKMIVGNKLDKEFSRQVKREEAEAFAERMGALFVECSAKTSTGVNEMFDELVTQIINTPSLYRRQRPAAAAQSSTVTLEDEPAGWGSYCAC